MTNEQMSAICDRLSDLSVEDQLAIETDLRTTGMAWIGTKPDGSKAHLPLEGVLAPATPSVKALAQSYLDRRDEDWTWIDPEDIKRLARAVLGMR